MSADCSLESIDEALSEFAPDAQQSTSDKPYPLVGARRLAIDHCFAKDTVEDILAALAQVEAGGLFTGAGLEDWANETRKTIEQRSPTSCKVTLIALRESKRLNIDDVFLMDLRLAATCCVRPFCPSRLVQIALIRIFEQDTEVHPDFHTGVSHLLIKKAKGRADWQPSDLAGVDLSDVRLRFFSDEPAPSTRLLPLRFLPAQMAPYLDYPHSFGLPKERDVAGLVTGEAKGSGSFAPTRAEVLKLAQRRWHGKVGVKERVEEILDRMTEEVKAQGESTLRWRG